MKILPFLPPSGFDPDDLYAGFVGWAKAAQGVSLYAHQDEAILEILTGANVVVTTPTGSGKTLIATAAHAAAFASGRRTYYTAPIKALVSEKFFTLIDIFGADNVGMVTGDASVNPDAPIVCCTAEIVANIALREGADAAIGQVVMDEFHYIADRDRGWAWQVPLVELPQAQFVIMSATLGDTDALAAGLEASTGRSTAVISDAVRPVPLTYRWALTPAHETIAEIVETHQAPVYVVHATQSAAVDRAQSLLSSGLIDKSKRAELNEALRGFRFAGGFGKTLSGLLHAGIAVHHAGMLPRYRRLVETLAQQGLLSVICGTDTLGVGINVPIRTVLFSALTKFDGRRGRVLRAREFHQIAGRAGRAGFDTVGHVVAQAPEHEVDNHRIVTKFADDPKKLKSVRRKKPPEGFINYTEATFEKLQAAAPEQLHGQIKVSHAMLLNLLARDEDTGAAFVHLVEASVPERAKRRALYKRAAQMGRSLLASGIVVRLSEPTAGGRRYGLDVDLQRDFALNQPLSAFALEALERLDLESPTYALDAVSVIEATLEDPRVILTAQQFKERGEAVAEMKADGYSFEERAEALEQIVWPQPLRELIDGVYEAYLPTHPWLAETPPSPKSIVRDCFERAMAFGEFVAFYKLQRSEGLLLRYLSDAYRALRQTVPESMRTDEFVDVLEWLGQVTRLVDSSLLDEWTALGALSAGASPSQVEAAIPHTITSNARAFRVLVRNAMFRKIELAAEDDVDALAALEPSGTPMTRAAWDDALGEYWDAHDDIATSGDARGPALFVVEELPGRRWRVRQIVADPAGDHDWQIEALVDLDASDASDELVLTTQSFGRLDG